MKLVLQRAESGHRGDLSLEVGLTERLVLLGKPLSSTNQANYLLRALCQQSVMHTSTATGSLTFTGGEILSFATVPCGLTRQKTGKLVCANGCSASRGSPRFIS